MCSSTAARQHAISVSGSSGSAADTAAKAASNRCTSTLTAPTGRHSTVVAPVCSATSSAGAACRSTWSTLRRLVRACPSLESGQNIAANACREWATLGPSTKKASNDRARPDLRPSSGTPSTRIRNPPKRWMSSSSPAPPAVVTGTPVIEFILAAPGTMTPIDGSGPARYRRRLAPPGPPIPLSSDRFEDRWRAQARGVFKR